MIILMIKKFQNQNFELSVYGSVETPYFKGREVALLLGYKCPTSAIRDNVDNDDKITLSNLLKSKVAWKPTFAKTHPHTVFINESGLYSLIMSSKLKAAKDFQRWVTSEVLPSIRKTGEYKVQPMIKQKLILDIQTENDLHKAVVNYLRTKYPNVLITATLGENQDTSEKRIDSFEKGYSKGIPDLLIFHKNSKFNGLVIEFKSPKGTGVLSSEQVDKLKLLQDQRFDVLVSNNLFEIIERIYHHMNLDTLSKTKTKIIKYIIRKNPT